MSKSYPEYKQLNLPAITAEILSFWEQHDIFGESVRLREGNPSFVFYEGPPSANGMPGIHHVMARTIKDIFCRYQTILGKQVHRKAGWDTHGLPIELAVEKTLGITKEDIGKSISVEDYNKACRTEVMKYTDQWEELTRQMGYWVDMKDPYITYDNKYIESVWWLLGRLFDKGLLYKGYTIQPYSPAAGTGLSSHELNQPGCYRQVKDRTAVAMFELIQDDSSKKLWLEGVQEVFFLAWTTTPWTLPSNTALAVGLEIQYVSVHTLHPFTGKEVVVILAAQLLNKYFSKTNEGLPFADYKMGSKDIPFKVVQEIKGSDLKGLSYHQLLPFAQPDSGDAFKVIAGDFVTTEDGTGIVHIAPSFGADDFKVAKQNGIGSLTLVDKRGRFLPVVSDGIFLYGNEYVKEAYLNEDEKQSEFLKQKQILESAGKIKELKSYLSVDERIVLKLQEEGKLFKKESYEHSYPHCWRTDKPVLYYPLDSWFVKIPEVRQRMVELNKTIHWKPESTGTGRFGNWLENANDWNLSRSRFWGIPLPIWRTEDGSESICISSAEQLQHEIKKSIERGIMKTNPLHDFVPGDFSSSNYASFDLHKPYVDDIVLVAPSGKPMYREADLIDVWFDSGAMPYAQVHYPFENKESVDSGKVFPADFIAEGVDQTRGWFYTLHAIATLCFDSVAYRNVISNGLVLDKNGNKMSKRLGNAVDPFSTMSKYGTDATRWYMITNAQPWDNLKFDEEGITEVQRKFFGTLYNTYGFFALYANVDQFVFDPSALIPVQQRTELDRWILSRLNHLVKEVRLALDDFEPTKAARMIEEFVDQHLSNWYVRLARKRFWKGEMSSDKLAAYQTLFEALITCSQLISPFAPFFADWLYRNLNNPAAHSLNGKHAVLGYSSVHLSLLPVANESQIDLNLERKMDLAQKVSSLILSIRKKENIRVRQPLNKIRIPLVHPQLEKDISEVKELILSEVNIKEIEFVSSENSGMVKNLKLNFKTLGKKFGKQMKAIQEFALQNSNEVISAIENHGEFSMNLPDGAVILLPEDVEIIPVDIPGWKVQNSGSLTVALDVTLTPKLVREGIARELVNRIQNLRKEKGLNVIDLINVQLVDQPVLREAVTENLEYICTQTLTKNLHWVSSSENPDGVAVELDETVSTMISINKVS
jgi:isoleucyl-tRNA synthetase